MSGWCSVFVFLLLLSKLVFELARWSCSETILETTLQKHCIHQTSELPTTSFGQFADKNKINKFPGTARVLNLLINLKINHRELNQWTLSSLIHHSFLPSLKYFFSKFKKWQLPFFLTRLPDGLQLSYACLLAQFYPSPSRLMMLLDPLLMVGILSRCINAYKDTNYLQSLPRYHASLHTESRQGTEQTRTFEPTNESEDCWSTTHSYNFIIRVK